MSTSKNAGNLLVSRDLVHPALVSKHTVPCFQARAPLFPGTRFLVSKHTVPCFQAHAVQNFRNAAFAVPTAAVQGCFDRLLATAVFQVAWNHANTLFASLVTLLPMESR